MLSSSIALFCLCVWVKVGVCAEVKSLFFYETAHFIVRDNAIKASIHSWKWVFDHSEDFLIMC